ncbi:hypothetical protein [Thermococcus sp. M39]|uniref:hypothetical protein n=1 Tax=Thermococcus sp. M39 TaxID=1638262 RepID=UPI001438776C|nr:hypothetical protein [Thermococcus sp. M39]
MKTPRKETTITVSFETRQKLAEYKLEMEKKLGRIVVWDEVMKDLLKKVRGGDKA